MSVMVDRASLQVSSVLADFLERQALPGTGIDPTAFWAGVAGIFARFAPENCALLSKRDELRAMIDEWHRARAGQPIDAAAYRAFLREIGYLVDEPAPFTIGTTNVDEEVARLAGPQLVVPVLNSRFVLNAANARWGSLYDAFMECARKRRPRPRSSVWRPRSMRRTQATKPTGRWPLI